MKTITATPLLVALTLTISACGGGGGGGGGGNGLSATLSIFAPTRVDASQLNEGVRSNNTGNNYGSGTINLPGNTDGSTTVSARNDVPINLLPTNHISDTQANLAWQDGWTGAGTTIAVIDDFQNASTTVRIVQDIERTVSNFWGTGQYSVSYRLDIPTTHGDLVSNIAGGDGLEPDVNWTVNLNSTSRTLISCTSGDCSFAPSAFVFIGDVYDANNALITYRKAAGVAKDALIIENHIDLSPFQNPDATIAALRSHVDNSFNHTAINLSAGSNINTAGVSFNEIVNQIDPNSLTRNSDAVVVVAAGNSGAACAENNLNGCNFLAVAATVLPQIRESVIIAGATQGSGSSESIASYSARAGVLKERFLLAPGGTGFVTPQGTEIQGTSFAAPRITGAAALLRHKFTNLSGQQAASILLLTANKDINNSGAADFTGVSDVFGHGKLDLMKALSPVGTLSIR